MTDLPINAVLEDISAAMRAFGACVLQAPPGAGKTTRVPLWLHSEGLSGGRILMLEPRRVAARAAATHIAELLGERPGQTAGYRMRGETAVGRETRIEVVTEGVLTAMIQSDPELSGIGTVIFDEFHERALQADLGLALTLEIREALRPDLKLIVMSATLDAAPVARLMGDVPVITSEGQSFCVDTQYLERPWARPGARGGQSYEASMADLTARAAASHDGDILVFLPGQREITRLQAALRLGPDVDVAPLYGALPFKAQTEALAPAAPGRRKVVLATSIAETSLTIPGVRIVVDGGLSRRPRFDPGSGMMRLITGKVSKAEAAQRRGRAGRVADGVCYRHWTRGEHGGLAPFAPVEMEDNDLLGLALELARWGARDAGALKFLTPPPPAALSAARALLAQFGALDGSGRITAHGRALGKLPLHPRLAQMVLRGGALGMAKTAADLAVLLEMRAQKVDLEADLRLFRAQKPSREAARTLERLRPAPDRERHSIGALVSLAFPDRIAQARQRDGRRYLMSGGKGAELPKGADLPAQPWLAVAETDGDAREARIFRAAPLSEAEIMRFHAPLETTLCHWDKRAAAVVSEAQTRAGALVLARRPADADPDQILAALLDGIAQMGLSALPWDAASRGLQARVNWARASGADLPDLSDAALLARLETWLGPWLGGMSRKADLAALNLAEALRMDLGREALARLEALAPERYMAPTGTGCRIDYGAAQPGISVRLQEMMGVTVHPCVGENRTPLRIELLSPARRPIQTTADLPGFWASSYADVRKDMRGRYPKHHWPEDPANAAPTAKAKSRSR